MAAMIVFNLFEKEACSTYYFELNFSIAVGKNAGQARPGPACGFIFSSIPGIYLRCGQGHAPPLDIYFDCSEVPAPTRIRALRLARHRPCPVILELEPPCAHRLACTHIPRGAAIFIICRN